MELIRYLNDTFITHDALLAHCGVDADTLHRWQARRMMPQPSYRLRLDIACDSFFGHHREQTAADYYARGSTEWIDVLRTLDDEPAAYAVFARRYRRRLEDLSAAGLEPDAALASDARIAAEWDHFLDGTYGLCTASGLPEDIAAKEAALGAIRELVDGGAALDDGARARLRRAVDLLDAVSSAFAPHEAARSSRRRWVDDVRRTYGP